MGHVKVNESYQTFTCDLKQIFRPDNATFTVGRVLRITDHRKAGPTLRLNTISECFSVHKCACAFRTLRQEERVFVVLAI